MLPSLSPVDAAPTGSPCRSRWRRLALLGLVVWGVVVALLVGGCGTGPANTPTDAPTPSRAAPSSAASVASPASPPASTPAASPSVTASGDGTCDYTVTGTAAKPIDPPSGTGIPTSGTVTFVLKLTEGDVAVKLDRNRAPCTVHSFESLAAQGFYDNTRCHRLTDSGIFVLQCGDPTGTGSGGPGYSFADETDGTESYPKGTVAMANAGPNTNGSQFFLVWEESPLPPNYTVFGTMDARSVDVVAGIASQGQDGSNPSGGGKPNSPAKITSVQRR